MFFCLNVYSQNTILYLLLSFRIICKILVLFKVLDKIFFFLLIKILYIILFLRNIVFDFCSLRLIIDTNEIRRVAFMSLHFTRKRKNMRKYRYDTVRGILFVVELWLPSCESLCVIRLNNVSPYGTIAVPFLQCTVCTVSMSRTRDKTRIEPPRSSSSRSTRFFFHATEMFPFQDLKYDITLTSMLFTYVSYALEHLSSLLHNIILIFTCVRYTPSLQAAIRKNMLISSIFMCA